MQGMILLPSQPRRLELRSIARAAAKDTLGKIYISGAISFSVRTCYEHAWAPPLNAGLVLATAPSAPPPPPSRPPSPVGPLRDPNEPPRSPSPLAGREQARRMNISLAFYGPCLPGVFTPLLLLSPLSRVEASNYTFVLQHHSNPRAECRRPDRRPAKPRHGKHVVFVGVLFSRLCFRAAGGGSADPSRHRSAYLGDVPRTYLPSNTVYSVCTEPVSSPRSTSHTGRTACATRGEGQQFV